MISFNHLYRMILDTEFEPWLENLPQQISIWQNKSRLTKFKAWFNVIHRLPIIHPDYLNLQTGILAKKEFPLNNNLYKEIKQLLKVLIPWRKGPFHLYGIEIDAEWRSNLKWEQVASHISPLRGRSVLDVGCGNGYYLWRILGQGARFALGVDPMTLSLCQFEAIRRLLGNLQTIHILPIGIEKLPPLKAFDTVFSMGVIYHRLSPLEHLYQLKNQLKCGGELILETLVIKGGEQQVLTPQDRYAGMHNVYFIPSAPALTIWLKKCGFINIRIVSQRPTSSDEQRSTDWMTYHSFTHILNPKDSSRTIEGYPRPTRAIIIANKP